MSVRSWPLATSSSGVAGGGGLKLDALASAPVSASPTRHDSLPPARRRAPAIDSLVPRDREQPCLEARRAPEALEPPVRQQKRLLRHIVGIGCRAGGREGGPVNGGLMPDDQLAECGGVAFAGSGDQVVVGHSVSSGAGNGWGVEVGGLEVGGWRLEVRG